MKNREGTKKNGKEKNKKHEENGWKNGKTAVEIIEYFKSGESHPNEIFQIYEELSKFSEKEIEEAIKETRIGDAIGMSYITAIEMKKMEDGIHIWKSGRK